MEWYKKLTIEQKINLKELCILICGVQFSDLTKVLGMKMTINTLYEKLKMEGALI